ncbi:MAG: nucleotide exchange factor GrpE [Nitrospirae bacterium]|nr:MAG: nucleotide exchange factor GrpE [Nitrospirota bacterium]
MVHLVNKDKEKSSSINELDSIPAGDFPPEKGGGERQGSDDDLKQALASKTEEAQALHDKHLRLAAEFENYKRLAQKDQRDYARFANESLLKDLLPIIDNLERAIKAAKEAPKEGAKTGSLIEGVELTLKQFMDLLAKAGVRQITSVGEQFDPARHQAVARVESVGAADNTVVEEFQKGYLLHERMLRAAMVTVASAPTSNQEHSSTGTA